ncbi:MAG: flagellar filament capping protein FliD [Balneolaceae bacterium]|nr:flagellar filament capping protein FliD [Balneolaceae bacterium]
MSSIQSLFRQSNPYEQFVQQLVQLESQQKLRLEEQQKQQNERKTALGDVSESISKFISQISELENPNNNSFQPIKTSSSNESVVRVNSAGGIDRPSNFNITVDRVATTDTRLGQVMNVEDFDLAASGDGSMTITIGDRTETIQVETTREDGDGNIVQKNNREVLDSFAAAVSEAFGDDARASVFQVSNDQVQFSIQSLGTGFDNRIQIDNATGVLAEVESTMTSLVPEEELDARFTIDGVTFTRSDNTVDDAIEGLSFTLLNSSDQSVQMSAQRDIDEARENIDSFIKSYNDMNSKIRQRTFIDGDNNSRGPLRNMRSIRGLTNNLRQSALLPMDGVEPGQVSRLSDIGITFQNNGTMVIDDQDRLNEALEMRPEEVAKLFSSEDSAIANMKQQAESFTKSGGIIASLEEGVDQTIRRLDTRIAQQERYLEQYEEQQRRMFNELQLIQERGQAQFNEVMSFRQGMGF